MTRARRSAAVLVAAVVLSSASATDLAHADALPTAAAAPHRSAAAPARLIIDTDLFSDADDVGALATAFALQNSGEARVLAIGVNTRVDRPAVADASPRCAAAIAQFYGHPDVPIGASQPVHGTEVNPVDFATPCAALASRATPPPQRAVTLYRRVLARQPDHSVIVVSLGYLANLAALLGSSADTSSPRTGAELIAAKVRTLVVMGGGYPSRDGENNFVGNPHAATRVAAHWPGRVIWDGYEVGDAIHTGQTISSAHPSDSPVRAAYEAFVGPGNWIYSYDLTAVYRAVRPDDPALTLSQPGLNKVYPDGSNRFRSAPHGHQYFLVLNEVAGLDASIEALLDQVPPPG